MAELVVLGVAQDAGYPHVGCTRPCCARAWADPALGRRVACLGIVDEGRLYLLDATPDLPRQVHALAAIAGTAPRIDGVFLTHAHIGHYLGLAWLGREGWGLQGVPVWAMPEMRAFLGGHGPWSQLVGLGNVALRPVEDGGEAGHLRVEPRRVPHRAELAETVAYVVRGPRRRALYLPDVDRWEGSLLEELLDEVDLAYLDATFYDDAELPPSRLREVPHPRVVDTLERLARMPRRVAEKVRFIHLNHTNPLLDASSSARAAVRSVGARVAEEHDRDVL